MPNGFCRVPLSPEVNTLQREVARNEGLVSRAGVQNSTVIADRMDNSWPGGGPFRGTLGLEADSFDDLKLVEWQDELHYR
jgi:hypothetical protein